MAFTWTMKLSVRQIKMGWSQLRSHPILSKRPLVDACNRPPPIVKNVSNI